MFIVNVQAAIMKDGKFLLIKRGANEEHAPGTMALVGGKVDWTGASYDVLENTLKREIDEEVGVEIEDGMHYVHSSSFVTDKGSPVVDVVFLCQLREGTAYNKSNEEVECVYWMTSDEVRQHPDAPPWLKESFNRIEKIMGNIKVDL
jgi:ADP-ribose pyrophosphatase YjhB (NUDIX family)